MLAFESKANTAWGGGALTLVVNAVLSVLQGVSVALVSRVTPCGAPTPYKALLIYQVFLFVPMGGYLLWRFPAWSLMYIAGSAAYDLHMASALLYPLIGMVSLWLSRGALLRHSPRSLLVAAGSVVVAGLAIVVATWDRLSVVGSLAAFAAGDPLTPWNKTPLLPLLGVFVPLVVAGWGATLWRLALLAEGIEGTRRAADENTEPHHVLGRTQQRTQVVDDHVDALSFVKAPFSSVSKDASR